MQMTDKADREGFQSGANKYAVYLATPEGQLRSGRKLGNRPEYATLSRYSSRYTRCLLCCVSSVVEDCK